MTWYVLGIKRKIILAFICSREAGLKDSEEQYNSRFPDKFGNLCIHHIGCPQVISNFSVRLITVTGNLTFSGEEVGH